MAWTTKTTRTDAWDAGARSIASLSGNGAFTFTVGQSTGIVCGLNESDLSVDYREINHAFWIEGNKYRIIESGEYETALADFTPGAVFRIERLEGEVQYLVDDVLVFTSTVPSTGTVFLDASLIAYNDTIIDATCIEEQYCSPVQLLLGEVTAFGVVEGDDQFGGTLLGRVFTTGESEDINEGEVLLSRLVVSGGTDDLNYGRVLLSSPPFILTNDLALPDIAVGEVQLAPLFVRGTSDPADANLWLGAVFSAGTDSDDYGGALLGLPFTYGTPQVSGSFSALWGQFDLSITFVQHLAIPESLHTSIYGTTAASLHRVSYEGTNTILGLHENAYGLTAQVLSTSTWSSTQRTYVQAAHEAIYSTFGLAPAFATHSLLWASASLAPSFSVHQAHWASTGFSTQLALHDALWSSRILTSTETLHTSDWASIGRSVIPILHTVEWGSSGGFTQQIALHESLWSSRILTSTHAHHFTTWASIGRAFVTSLNEVSWSTVGGITQQISLHESLWSSRILTSSLTLHESTWTSSGLQVTMASHQSLWRSVDSSSQNLNLHQTTWASFGTSTFVFSAHDASWSVRPTLLHAHEQQWKSIVETALLHHALYETVDNTVTLQMHRLIWRSNQTAPIITTGLIYARI